MWRRCHGGKRFRHSNATGRKTGATRRHNETLLTMWVRDGQAATGVDFLHTTEVVGFLHWRYCGLRPTALAEPSSRYSFPPVGSVWFCPGESEVLLSYIGIYTCGGRQIKSWISLNIQPELSVWNGSQLPASSTPGRLHPHPIVIRESY